jgi:putative ABC transport system substrate-binding protein
MIRRREVITLLGGAAAAWPLAARAQQPIRMRRIGLLLSGTGDDEIWQAQVAALQQGLRELNWEEGRNLRIEYRWGGADSQRFRAYAAELVGLAPDLILSNTTQALVELKRVTDTIPVVFVQISDPVSAGFVANLARPGGNMTGFSNFEYTISGKWLQILKEAAPTIAQVGVLLNPTDPSGQRYLRTVEEEISNLGAQLTRLDVRDAIEVEQSIDVFARQAAAGLIVFPSPITSSNRDRIIARSVGHRLPAIYPNRFFAAAGGLISYGIDPVDLHRRAASYVDRVLRGAKPAELPVEQPTKFELIINLTTAKALKLTIPEAFLLRADEVIE